jgi:hypothetical protein
LPRGPLSLSHSASEISLLSFESLKDELLLSWLRGGGGGGSGDADIGRLRVEPVNDQKMLRTRSWKYICQSPFEI